MATFENVGKFSGNGREKYCRFFDFDTRHNSELEIKVALSAVSTNGALKNLRAEAEGKSFEDIRLQAADSWKKALELFEIEGSESQKRMFYTSLYHTMINPSVYMDVDGHYRGVDHNVHVADGFTNYSVFQCGILIGQNTLY